MRLFVFATARKTRAFYEEALKKDGLLDKAISVAEFFDTIIYSQRLKASEYERLLLMKRAAEHTKNANKLFIPQEFFAFLRNNEYLFSFFKELALADKSVEDLRAKDYYTQYDEHLQILNELLKNYLSALKEANLCDGIALCKDYEINFEFLRDFDEMIFDLQGFLNAFEIGVLMKCAKITRVNLHFHTSKFNFSHLKSLPFCKDLNLKNEHFYELNLNDNALLKEQKLDNFALKISVKKFEQRSLQAAFVFERISHFIRSGINPKDIVVITPDEAFCTLLKIYDTNNMLNFATGKPINETSFFQGLKALYEAAKLDNFNYDDDDEYLQKSEHLNLANTRLKCLEIQGFNAFNKAFYKEIDFENFALLINGLIENESVEIRNQISDELLFIKALLSSHTLTLKELLELFFVRIQNIKQSDVRGGAVRVMGLLESRGVAFEGVIIVDFNDEFIPKRSVNELFLNNEVRAKAGLFSYEMNENLQRFYYESLMQNAKEVAISFVENEQSAKSRFLQELKINYEEDVEFSQKAYQRALRLDYVPNKIDLKPLKAEILNYNLFDKPLSYSRLDKFIKNKRTYFYQYIKQIYPARELIETNEAKELGTHLHELLQNYYSTYKNSFDYEEFKFLLEKSTLSKLDKALFKLRFKEFAKFENEHFATGFKVKFCEKKFDNVPYKINGKEILLEGRVDRVDERGDELYIIDYKTGKIPENSYQLAFYQALFKQRSEAVFYDLKSAQKSYGDKSKNLDELNALFAELLAQVGEIEFEKDEKNTKENENCPYKLIYEKDLL